MSLLAQHGLMMAAAYGALWTPADLGTAPRIWLDWDSSVTDVSGFASAWANRGSLGGSFSQGSSGSRPEIKAAELNGKRVLRFDGSNDFMLMSAPSMLYTLQTGYHFIVLKKRTSATPTWGAIPAYVELSNGLNRLGCAYEPAGADANKPFLYGNPGSSGAQPKIVVGAANIGAWDMLDLMVEWGGGTAYAYRNGAAAGTQSCPTSNLGYSAPLYGCIGASHNGNISGTHADIDVAVVLWGEAISSTEMRKLEGWAAWELGLEGNLPGGHPYKSAPPTV